MPSFYRERSISLRGVVAGIGMNGEYQLMMERLSIPAVAISAKAFIPTGPNALRTSYSVKGLLTRSSPVGRIHLNASYGSFAVRQAPMSAGIAPAFSDRYPEAAIIFDNLHSLHDVVSDILANPAVPRSMKRREILAAAARYRDDHSNVTSVEECARWRMRWAWTTRAVWRPSVG